MNTKNHLGENYIGQSKNSSARKRIYIFQIIDKSAHGARCANSHVLTKVIDTVFDIA